jgi:hypothetical protein
MGKTTLRVNKILYGGADKAMTKGIKEAREKLGNYSKPLAPKYVSDVEIALN